MLSMIWTGSADKWIRVFDATSPVKLVVHPVRHFSACLAIYPASSSSGCSMQVSKRKFIGLVTSVDFSPDSRQSRAEQARIWRKKCRHM